jgi:hypothetical protein
VVAWQPFLRHEVVVSRALANNASFSSSMALRPQRDVIFMSVVEGGTPAPNGCGSGI